MENNFDSLEFTEIESITNLPPESVPYITCPICDSNVDYESGSHPVFCFKCQGCRVLINIEVKDDGNK